MSTSASPSEPRAVVAVIMGSKSDLAVMQGAVDVLAEFDVPFETRVLSAHRTPEEMLEFGLHAQARGLRVVVAGAGGAAHLPGMLASATTIPVIGVPIALTNLSGLDSLLSIVQMPRGVPVATVAINGARNAALLAVRVLALADSRLSSSLSSHREALAAEAHAQDAEIVHGPLPLGGNSGA